MNQLNYLNYKERLESLLENPLLKEYGIKKYTIGKTNYAYDFDYLTVGYGERDIFLVGGTHGSEVISTDFILQLLSSLPTLEHFDPNVFTLKIIPLQNPEGYDISTATFSSIDFSNFEDKAYEYYLRYRADNIIYTAIQELIRVTFEVPNDIMEDVLQRLKNFTLHNEKWLRLKQNRVFPKIDEFNHAIQEIEDVSSKEELCGELIMHLKQIEDRLNFSSVSSAQDKMYFFFLNALEEVFIQMLMERKRKIVFPKLYQDMFKEQGFHGLQSKELEKDIESIYKIYHHPLGSQINFDANGSGVNLNANHLHSIGMEAYQKHEVFYGLSPKDNIQKYVPGPIGTSCLNYHNFTYAAENIFLENLIKESFYQGRYEMTFLYHSSGGMIYYKPYQDLMKKEAYFDFYQYNQTLAEIYERSTNYQILEESSTTGYGDYLRRTYPGVLLIELSKMGGNPLGPYGDGSNTIRVFEENNAAINEVFHYLKKEKGKIKRKDNNA